MAPKWASTLLLALAFSPAMSKKQSKPNVLVIMTDDQDQQMDSLSVQPNVLKQIGGEGIQFMNHYCTVAWCCPSRVNFFTGRAAHNTNVTALTPPYGGWPTFLKQKLNGNYLPVWINNTGISTYYVGKIMNDYTEEIFGSPHPNAWTQSSFLVDPSTYNYYNGHWTDGYTGTITPFKGTHTTIVTQEKALAFLDDAAAVGNQFFMMVAPIAPHLQRAGHGSSPIPPDPPGFENAFSTRKVPRTPDFNPDKPSGASWVSKLPQLTKKEVKYGDKVYQHRLANVAGVDDMVSKLIARLDKHNLLDNTYIIYTTDNGFHISQHRLPPGKRCGYETDINIPLLMRGPGIPKNVKATTVNTHTDMAPTILQMLGVPLQDDFDGAPIPYTNPTVGKNEYVNVEFWNGKGGGDDDGPIELASSSNIYKGNTYKSLRIISGKESFYYSVWCDGEHEFYDMNTDFYQMNNLLAAGASTAGLTYYGQPAQQLFNRLDTLLLVLKECAGDSCRNPYGVLFPKNQVTDLSQAMNEEYNDFFAGQPKVSFTECSDGHIIAFEGPQQANVYQSGD